MLLSFLPKALRRSEARPRAPGQRRAEIEPRQHGDRAWTPLLTGRCPQLHAGTDSMHSGAGQWGGMGRYVTGGHGIPNIDAPLESTATQ